MKSLLQRLEQLPEPYRSRAIANHKRLGAIKYHKEYDDGSVKSAVAYAFNWILSEEGGDYWKKVYGVLKRLDNL